MHYSNFSTILVEHGFLPTTYDFQATALGFSHDIYNALIYGSLIFNDQSRIYQQLGPPDALLHCKLITHTGEPIAAIPHFYQKWVAELRYHRPVREVMHFDHRAYTTTINVLLISQYNAMTFEFNIT